MPPTLFNMPPRITLVCHATTQALRSATFGGDDPLDEVGRTKAARLAGSLAGVADRCFTSPALRARETAAALGLSAVVDERLRDCDYGRWTGLKLKQVMFREPRKLMSWVRNPSAAPHGGETIEQVLQRVAAWIGERGHEPGHTVAVTHAAVIRAAIVHVIQAQLPSFWRIDVLPLSQTDLRTNGRRWVLRSLGPIAAEDADG
jgi:broad specificity phosphatase PhoE